MTYVLIYGATSASFYGKPCRLVAASGMVPRVVLFGGAA